MGKRDSTRSAPRIDQYRAALGRQEFKGRSKKTTQAMKEQSQIKESTKNEAVSNVIYVATLLLGTLVLLYALLWYALQEE
eukprot:CAMPEP_0182944006 /NCGR_PEP_ID=MMETSP0105_2-20130417/53276_1 /TAXON_ID=81532 ORGANISM="Acanthoeca-like sp., Strain 10tr" /NCGR_SAMPLE_ID=MMETSP0105_2 /ASSEMBLY_ACC=CAM_ASM_000205 /LENGTH=79 /DNA_ID=CAMNT_0025083901 /DNA_START=84 /DNA_END=323 /DNA_ORIENTATION=-